MEKKITLFHGSEKVIEHPVFGAGKKHNDFGLGFYCTESEALAKEWAVSSLRDGFANRYTLDTEYLHILNLNSPDYTILNWIAVLVEHRLLYKCSSWHLLYCLLVTILLSKNKICNRLFFPVNCFKWHLFDCSCTVGAQIPTLPETWCIQFKYIMSFWKTAHLHGNPLTAHTDS